MAKENITPTITPASFTPNDEITIEYDATGTLLADLDDTYIWVWIPSVNVDAKYNVNPANSNADLSANAKFEKTVEGDKTLFTIKFVPQEFFAQPICLDTKLGMLIKGNDWSDGQSEDHEADMTPLESCFVVNLLLPEEDPFFLEPDQGLQVRAESSDPATFTLSVDGQQVHSQSNATYYSYQHAVPQTEGTFPVSLSVVGDEGDTTIQFSYLINFPSEELTRPSGIIEGINYHADETKATLCLRAPGKAAAYALGEFNDFEFASANKMYKDGDYFWYEVTGLTSGTQYAFRYLVDGDFIADPYADMILTPDDGQIPSSIYPNLKVFPEAGKQGVWYKDRLGVIQTGQTAFDWQHVDYQMPKKDDLVIYEMLIRDFFSEEERNYENLIDTLDYLKRLGVNAIELMPVQEFSGNDSWGYNPNSMFAPDKAYGTKGALKRFIDAAHGEGMAVIFDIVFNQQDTPNAFLSMWFDYDNFQVEAGNPMFNVNATHPFNVFFDMNHESEMTQHYMDTTLHYWIDEYKIDGYRFDLSKGFTQTNSGNNVGQWGNYDQSRIDILTRMYDEVRTYSTDSYLILEHFGDNSEEKVLADYGFLLWGNMHWDYKDLADGKGKNIAWGYHGTRGWQEPNVVAFMESHDEQRIMFELLTDQDSDENLTRDDRDNPSAVRAALDRVKLASTFLYTIPGPKMFWQFGELGYQEPINLCTDGETIGKNGDCRTDKKPVGWGLRENSDRNKLYDFLSALLNLKTEYPVFESGDFTMTNNNDLVKEIILANENAISNPASANEMSVYVIGNFDLEAQSVDMAFPFTGNWYDFFDGGEPLQVTQSSTNMTLEPGHFRLYVNYEIPFPEAGLQPIVTSVEDDLIGNQELVLYPNPASDLINIDIGNEFILGGEVLDMTGRKIPIDMDVRSGKVDVSHLNGGVYILKVHGQDKIYTQQFIKK